MYYKFPKNFTFPELKAPYEVRGWSSPRSGLKRSEIKKGLKPRMKRSVVRGEVTLKIFLSIILSCSLLAVILLFPSRVLAASPSISVLQYWLHDPPPGYDYVISIDYGDLRSSIRGDAGETFSLNVCFNLVGPFCPLTSGGVAYPYTYTGYNLETRTIHISNADVNTFSNAGIAVYGGGGSTLIAWIPVDLSSVPRVDNPAPPPGSCSAGYLDCSSVTVVVRDDGGSLISGAMVSIKEEGKPTPTDLLVTRADGTTEHTTRSCVDPVVNVTASTYEAGTGSLNESSGVCSATIALAASAPANGGVIPPYVSTFDEDAFATAAANAQKYAIGLGVFLSLFILPYIGILWASGNPENIQKATEWFQSWFWGLLLLLLSGTVIRLVGSDILKIG